MRPLALVLVGSRSLNKRTCRFVESLRSAGFDPVVAAIPRQAWGTSGYEESGLAARPRFATLGTADPRPRVWRRPHLVVCMHWALLPVAILLKALLGVRVVYDEHDDYEMLALEGLRPAWVNRFGSSSIRRLHTCFLRHVDVVTCIRLAGGRLRRDLEAQATTVVELHNYPSKRWGLRGRDDRGSDGSVAIVYVGGIWDVKGCGDMLEAFLLLADDHALPPVTLHAFGRGDRQIEQRLSKSPGVTFHGESTADAIVGFLGSHDCLGLLLLDATPRYSLASTNCHKLYEYLATGTPVLATKVGEIPDIVAMLDGGWIIEAGFDVDMLATRLREILSRPEEIRRRGEAAAAAVEADGLWWEGEWQKVERLGVLDLPGNRGRPDP